MTEKHYLQLCNTLLAGMGWTWDNPRIVDWLARLGRITTGRAYTLASPIPENVYVSLAKFLDLYDKCERNLQLLEWDWGHEKVRSIQAKYRCVGQLPLKGYRAIRLARRRVVCTRRWILNNSMDFKIWFNLLLGVAIGLAITLLRSTLADHKNAKRFREESLKLQQEILRQQQETNQILKNLTQRNTRQP